MTTRQQCPPRRRRFAAACPLPAWGGYGPGPFAILMWTPVLLIDPVLSLPRNGPLWLAASGLAAIAAVNVAAVIVAYRDRPWAGRAVLALLAAQTLLTLATTSWYGAHWGVLFTLLGLAYGAVAPPGWAPLAVLCLTAVSAVVPWWQGAPWTQVWVTALTTFLCGMATFGFHRLLTVIAELDATRQQLALEAVDRERLRFSRDLHDLLGHTLSVIVVKAEAIRRLLPDDTAAAAEHAGDIENIGRESLVEVRQAVSGYRDTDLSRELDRAKIALDAAGIKLRAEPPAEPLPSELDTLFGWAVREGVTNVVRHSGADNCRIAFADEAATVRLTVTDDGSGGEPLEGSGLRGLRERAAAADGEVTAARTRQGFTLTVEAPHRSAPDAGPTDLRARAEPG
ncbi:sensor histidine kinase [Stackebrandtia nassauensis]|uniref:sensor histidine kinase n=1 Tax=Stackebrandtia nassauensis TaxID=283811 RepID=UPI0001A3915F|nr:sensor histidine kinase [Stackebrandtia nassauensis]